MKDKFILIVDDDSRNIFALSLILKAKGYHTISCSFAKEAIQILENQNNISVVLMDMMMPEMDGYEAIRTIRGMDKINSIPIIAVTAQAMEGDSQKCLYAGANAYIAKPIDVDKLMQEIENLQ